MIIPVYRATTATDVYGDPQPVGPVSTWSKAFDIDGKHAPSNPAEALEPGKNTIIAGGIVYSRDPAARNVRPTDAVGIGGVRYLVDGKVGQWADTGVQFAVRSVS